MIVVDSNVVIALFLTTESSRRAEQLLRKDHDWAAPFLWRSEFQIVLALYIRKRSMSLEIAQQIMDAAVGMMAGREYSVVPSQVLNLVAKSSCSAYDCEFVALAEELHVPLVTVDRQVLQQFPDTAISLDQYATSVE